MSTETTTQESDAARLNVSDLQQLAVIVDVAFRKGLFNAEEAVPVSALYAKLVNFLRQFEQKAAEDAESAAPATEEPKE